jgi:hypothetical protein
MTWGNPTHINWNIPGDARIVQEDDSWIIYYSVKAARLYIYPACYHAQALPLDAEDLLRLLQVLVSSQNPKQQDDNIEPLVMPMIPPPSMT